MLEFLERMCLEISSTWSQRQKWVKSPREKEAHEATKRGEQQNPGKLQHSKGSWKSNVIGKISKSPFHGLFLPPFLIYWCSQGSMLSPCPLTYTPISSPQNPKSQLPTRHCHFNIPEAIQAFPQGPSSDTVESENSFYYSSFSERHYHSPWGSSLNSALDHSVELILPYFLHLSLLHSKNSISFQAFLPTPCSYYP